MGFKLVRSKKDVRPEDCDELVVWLKDGGNREGEKDADGAEKCIIKTRFLSTGETNDLTSKTEARKNKSKNENVDEELERAVRIASKAVVSIDPLPVDDAGTEYRDITPEVINGLPDWVLLKISQHLNTLRGQQKEQEKNLDGSSDSA